MTQNGYSVNYGYNSQNLINSVENIDNYELNFAYTEGTDKKVTTIDEVGTGGISIDYSYAHNATEVQDSTGNSLTYQFDNYGRVTSVKDAEGYAQYSSYFSEGSKNNKINSASRLQRTVQNLLLNGSFEGSNSAVTMVGGAAVSTADSLYGGKSLLITSSAAKHLPKCGFETQYGVYSLCVCQYKGDDSWQCQDQRSVGQPDL